MIQTIVPAKSAKPWANVLLWWWQFGRGSIKISLKISLSSLVANNRFVVLVNDYNNHSDDEENWPLCITGGQEWRELAVAHSLQLRCLYTSGLWHGVLGVTEVKDCFSSSLASFLVATTIVPRIISQTCRGIENRDQSIRAHLLPWWQKWVW